ncbi:MAG: response regulator [Micavibrio aeruginosavorus]|uniref:Response regulator n=1 Tax=Micavibrio aeruginosavorus TaxID=349221 RepID=A0A2W5FES8_9BACT|nr:MAG: response regulator [Micavibrio aeruginosavorus]
MAHILLAEDDDSMRQFLELALGKAGHKVTPCSNGLEALDLVKQQGANFDMLLADIVMPGMDGIELSQKAAAIYPSLKVMFITGFAAVAMGQRNAASAAAGQARILSKPFHLNDLVKQVEELLISEPKTED